MNENLQSGHGGYVYILTNECFRQYAAGPLVKVGKAKSPDARIGNLNTSCPENFKVYRLVRTEDNTYTKIETEIFNRLWDVRHYTKQGEPTEFLHCSPQQVLLEIMRIVQENNYNVTYSTLAIGRSAVAIRSNSNRTGRNASCLISSMECGNAKIEKTETGWIVKKRSHIANVRRMKKIFSQRVQVMRKQYKDKISSRGILMCDVPCASLSEAALFVLGCQTNGKTFWHEM